MKAVLFDFSGTLCRVEPVADWLRGTLRERGMSLTEEEFARQARALREAGALPGGPAPVAVPPELAQLWEARDRSAALHRAAYTALSRQVPLGDESLHDSLYDRHMRPEAWRPYPDALEVLSGLRDKGVPTAVVSNIGWDPRPVLRAHGLDRHIGAYVLSYEHGVQKPDAALFAVACRTLGVAPRDTLMVGDNRGADGGASALGCAVHFVDHLPVGERPAALLPVLALLG
ncbi:HAD family hydrolase [Streptomyces tsukubensis]|uniref:Hydrolase n=1 Tax=Streptomyces tsukubensis TaxID=83656 RepID=A0A1V3ZZ91_9ACTN|nr:HAD family hydrolase [Streptomyces tsukubensis]OON71805.1 hydrolase [Streptomyces tsukubensis]QFR98187.1 HAD family hydrolase [Streptomyces tsukubensis]